MYMPSSLGNFSIATLPQNFNNSVTTWYIPMFNYVGAAYISQIASGGSLTGSGVLTAFSANSFTITGTKSFPDGMNVAYNTVGGNWGLQFTGVQLANYTLTVMFIGLYNANIYFTGNNPSYSTYTVTTGTAPTCTTFSTNNANYTTFVFYNTSAIQFSVAAAIQGNDSTSGYTTYMLSGTQTPSMGNGTAGATCVYIPTGVGYSTQNVVVTAIGFWNNTTTTVSTDSGTFSCSLGGSPANYPFNARWAGGKGSNSDGGTLGAGGGSAGPGGSGTAASTGTSIFPSTTGKANTLYNNLGQNGTLGSNSRGGIGGGGKQLMSTDGFYGLVVITVAGWWQVNVPGPSG